MLQCEIEHRILTAEFRSIREYTATLKLEPQTAKALYEALNEASHAVLQQFGLLDEDGIVKEEFCV